MTGAPAPGLWIRLTSQPGHPLTQWRKLREIRPYAGPAGWDVLLDFEDGYTAAWSSNAFDQFETAKSFYRPDLPR